MDTQLITTPVLVLVGPTAIGKTSLSLSIAARFGCEIISMDSMQVYRGMDIGTAKASLEERGLVRHHLIDIVDPDQPYDAASFVRDALKAIEEIAGREKIPLITGGTGMYLSSLINGLFDTVQADAELRLRLRQRLAEEGREVLHRELIACDPASGKRIHINDTQRLLRGLEIFQATGIPWSEHLRRQREHTRQSRFTHLLCLGLTCARPQLYDRIKNRTINMMKNEFQKEVEGLLALGYSPNLPAMQSIGYRHMMACIRGEWSRETATEILIRDTRRYAKRQMTWFGHQQAIIWHDIHNTAAITPAIEQLLRQASVVA